MSVTKYHWYEVFTFGHLRPAARQRPVSFDRRSCHDNTSISESELKPIDGNAKVRERQTLRALDQMTGFVGPTARYDADTRRMYCFHANRYIVTPLDFRRFLQAIQSISAFWLSAVKVPHEGRL